MHGHRWSSSLPRFHHCRPDSCMLLKLSVSTAATVLLQLYMCMHSSKVYNNVNLTTVYYNIYILICLVQCTFSWTIKGFTVPVRKRAENLAYILTRKYLIFIAKIEAKSWRARSSAHILTGTQEFMQQLAEKPPLHITVCDTDNLGFPTNSAVFRSQRTRILLGHARIFSSPGTVHANSYGKWLEPNSYELKVACKPKPA